MHFLKFDHTWRPVNLQEHLSLIDLINQLRYSNLIGVGQHSFAFPAGIYIRWDPADFLTGF
jgi:hypothetical protein